MAVRDENGFVLCCHGRPMTCVECGEEYAEEIDRPAGAQPEPTQKTPSREWLMKRIAFYANVCERQSDIVVTLTAERDEARRMTDERLTALWPALVRERDQLAEALTACQQERDAMDLRLQAASGFVRDVIEALGREQPPLDAVVDLPALAMEVVGQIEEGKQAAADLTACRAQGEAMRAVVEAAERVNAAVRGTHDHEQWFEPLAAMMTALAALSSTPTEPQA